MLDKDRSLQRFIRLANEIRASVNGSSQQLAGLTRLYSTADYVAGLLQMEADDNEANTPIGKVKVPGGSQG